MDTVRQLILDKMKEAGKNLRSLSLEIDQSHSYLQQFIKRGVPRHLPEEPRERLAAALGIDADLLRGTPAPGALPSLDTRRAPPQNARAAGNPVELGPTVPLIGQGAAGKDGDFVFTGRRVTDVLAHPALARISDAYAIYVMGELMLPRYEPGEIVFVDPNRPPNRGHYVVVKIAGEDGDPPAGYIRRYVDRNSKLLRIEQLNPKKVSSFPTSKVVSVHRIIMGGDG